MLAMISGEQLLGLGEQQKRAFEDFKPDQLCVDQRNEYMGWLALNPNYEPSFSSMMDGARRWADRYPAVFGMMLEDFDVAVEFINKTQGNVSKDIFPNFTEYYQKRQTDTALPLLRDCCSTGEQPSRMTLARTIVRAAKKFRLSERIQPDEAYHLHVKSGRGMVATTLLELYEHHVNMLELYPEDTENGALISGAITEALYMTRPAGPLFKTLKARSHQWIYEYPGFSQSFKELVYTGCVTGNNPRNQPQPPS